MAHDPPRLCIGETAQRRRLVRLVIRDVEDARLFIVIVGRWVCHKLDPTTPRRYGQPRSSARQPMSERLKPPGQSIVLMAA